MGTSKSTLKWEPLKSTLKWESLKSTLKWEPLKSTLKWESLKSSLKLESLLKRLNRIRRIQNNILIKCLTASCRLIPMSHDQNKLVASGFIAQTLEGEHESYFTAVWECECDCVCVCVCLCLCITIWLCVKVTVLLSVDVWQ